MKRIMKHFLSLLVLSLVFVPMMTMGATPTEADYGVGTGPVSSLKLGDKDPVDSAISLINFAMMFLGLIAVGIILLAGFKWMTAGGNEDKVADAKKLMASGVIGLVILLSAWGIAKYVLQRSVELTTGATLTQ